MNDVPAGLSQDRDGAPGAERGIGAGLYAWFKQSADRDPGQDALVISGQSYSYRQLDEAATNLAVVLHRTTRPGPIGVIASRTIEAFVGYLAASRLNRAVVPLAVDSPVQRNRRVCQAAGVVALVADRSLGAEPHFDQTWRTLAPVIFPEDTPRLLCTDVWEEPNAEHVAYILFTSGTTGAPKGVPIRNKQLSEYIPFAAAMFQVDHRSRLSQTFDLTFDPSVFDMAVTWYAGGTLVVPTAEELLAPASFVASQRISHWFSVPALISIASRMHNLQAQSMPSLQFSAFAGEPLTVSDAQKWQKAAPNSRIANLYGPTELTVTSTGFMLPLLLGNWPTTDNGTVPIGAPNDHLEAALRTASGFEVLNLSAAAQIGLEGELCIRGSQRFDGYLDPRDNEGVFVRDDGSPISVVAFAAASLFERRQLWYRTGDLVSVTPAGLVHRGRLDSQVKIAGKRIEIGEIESSLRAFAGVQEVAVVVAGTGRVKLHAFVVGDRVTPEAVRRFAKALLPAHGVPHVITVLEALPLSRSGKIDRKALGAIAASGSAQPPPP